MIQETFEEVGVVVVIVFGKVGRVNSGGGYSGKN